MESYGNKKEVGICCLWVAAQGSLNSPDVLRIVVNNILPYYSYKHYRTFTVSVLSALAASEPSGAINVDMEEFVEFFDEAHDPKRKRDLEKFYHRIKDATLNSLSSGDGAELFEILLPRLGKPDFMPLSVVGHETLDLLSCCVDYDSTAVLPLWQDLILRHPRESGVLLNYMVKNVDKIQNGGSLETQLFKSEKFAEAAAKNPELNRFARKFGESFKQAEAARKRGRSWFWLYILLVLSTSIGLLYFDVHENGKGLFSQSKSGKFLAQYGLLDDALYIGERTRTLTMSAIDQASPYFRSLYERIQPVLQAVDKQSQIYLPKVVELFQKASEQVVLFGNYLAKEVFVGQLSPENLRKVSLEALALVYSYVDMVVIKVFEAVGHLVNYLKAYL